MTAATPEPPLRAVAQADAARLAQLLQQGKVARELRPSARALLAEAWRALSEPEEPSTPPVAAAVIAGLARDLEAMLRQCGDDHGAGARPLQQVRVARPLPDRVAVPPSARQTESLARAVGDHFRARVALTADRLAWFETRSSQQPPTQVATVKQPDGEPERADLELLRKAGKSKFS